MIAAPEPTSGRWPPRARLAAIPAGNAEGGAAGRAPGGPRRPSVLSLMHGLVADASGLIQAEVRLAHAETSANLAGLGGAIGRLLLGGLLVALGLGFGLVLAIVALSLALGLVGALLVVTVLSLGAGVGLVLAGRRRLAGVRLLPVDALGRIGRDIEWLKEREQP